MRKKALRELPKKRKSLDEERNQRNSIKYRTPSQPQPQPQPNKCHFCHLEFRFNSWLKRHIKQHTDERTVSCSICQKSFRNGQGLEKHMVTHTAEKHIRCTQCEKAFKCDRHLQQHIKLTHMTPSQIPCQICHTLFKRDWSLRLHMQSQHPATVAGEQRTYECYICRKQQKSEPTLKAHIYEHTRARNWLCPQCGMRFKTQSTLEVHSMRNDHHLGGEAEKPFHCEVCGKRFANIYVLKGHERVHTGERPFSCSICGKDFGSKTNLRQHAVVHSERRPFQCNICEYTCKTNCNLRKHLLIHTRS